MPRAITRRCRGIAKAWVNIWRHHTFPAISPCFIFDTRPDKRRTHVCPFKTRRRSPQTGLALLRRGLGVVGLRSALAGPFWGFWWRFLIMARGDAREFGQYPGVYCTTAGGQVDTNPEGRRFCAICVDRPAVSTPFMANSPLATNGAVGFRAHSERKALVLLVLPTE